MMLQQQYFSGDPVSFPTHLIHRLDCNGFNVRMKMSEKNVSQHDSEMVSQ